VSRYSDLNGYWLLGFLATKRASLEIDLRGGTQKTYRDSPEDCFAELARRKFDEQLGKWRVPIAWVAGARLDVIWSRDVTRGFVGGTRQDGYEGTFAASVKTDLGRTMFRAKHVFVAPHNPCLESKSARAV
jgi:hypothetical protein